MNQRRRRPAATSSRTTTAPRRRSLLGEVASGIHDTAIKQPFLDYIGIMVAVLFLVALGVVMVFSSSMTWSLQEGGGVYSTALRQCLMVVLGLGGMWFSLRIPMSRVHQLAGWSMVVGVACLILVLIPGIGTGAETVGSQSWIPIGPFQFQPSELARITIALWGASYLSQQPIRPGIGNRRLFIYFLVAGLCILLIAKQGDLGMAITFGLVVGFTLLFAGIDIRYLVWGFVLVFITVVVFLFSQGGYRQARLTTYLDALTGKLSDTRGADYQTYQGFLSLADGSWTGVGIGQSRAKWFYLPEAKNDFIFAIIGEEMGFWGGVLVILLFTILAVFGIRAALRAQNRFQSLLAAALTCGVVFQAFYNIGYVIGLLPVTGIQLPMISAGGTSAVLTIASMGLLASVARHEPESVSAMHSYGRPFVDRLLLVGVPRLEGRSPVVAGGQDAAVFEESADGLRERRRWSRAPRATPVTERKAPRAGTRTGAGSVGGRSQPVRRPRRADPNSARTGRRASDHSPHDRRR